MSEKRYRLSKLLLVLLFIIAINMSSRCVAQISDPTISRKPTVSRDEAIALEKFKDQLQKRFTKDQGLRKALIRHQSKVVKENRQEAAAVKENSLSKKVVKIDRQNLQWLKKQIDANGFPQYPVIGESAAQQFFVLIIHADRDPNFQLNCLSELKAEPSHWPESFAKTLALRLKLVNPRAFKQSEHYRSPQPAATGSQPAILPNESPATVPEF